jgi:hypothetical protein
LGFWRASPAWTLWVPKPNSLSEFEDDVMESFKEKPKERTEEKQGIRGNSKQIRSERSETTARSEKTAIPSVANGFLAVRLQSAANPCNFLVV